MSVGIQVHTLEKEHTSGCGWWVLLCNQHAYSERGGLKHKRFLLEEEKKAKIQLYVEFREKNTQYEEHRTAEDGRKTELEKPRKQENMAKPSYNTIEPDAQENKGYLC